MFPHMTASPDSPPSAEEMERAREAVQFDKVVKLKDVTVRTYDLSDDKQVEQYTKDRKYVMVGMQKNELSLLFADHRFVESIPGYMAHMEWIEFELKVDPVQPATGVPQGDTNG